MQPHRPCAAVQHYRGAIGNTLGGKGNVEDGWDAILSRYDGTVRQVPTGFHDQAGGEEK